MDGKLWKNRSGFGEKLPQSIHLSRRPHTREGDYWVSFESDPYLTKTRKNVYEKCLPCIQNLLEQLNQGRSEIDLGEAFACWKVVAVLKDLDQCFEVLSRYEKRFLSGYVYGKLGGRKEKGDSKVVVFHTQNEKERDLILIALKQCAQEVNPGSQVFYSRACANLYEELLGDWRDWKQVTPIKHPQKVKEIIERIKKLLYYSS